MFGKQNIIEMFNDEHNYMFLLYGHINFQGETIHTVSEIDDTTVNA